MQMYLSAFDKKYQYIRLETLFFELLGPVS